MIEPTPFALTLGSAIMAAPIAFVMYDHVMYADPLPCGCLHQPTCDIYVPVENDPRGFSSPEKIEPPTFLDYIYILAVRCWACITIIPAAVWSAKTLAEARHVVEICQCLHSSECRFARRVKTTTTRPPGCEGWAEETQAGIPGHRSPDRDTWTASIEARTASSSDEVSGLGTKLHKNRQKQPYRTHFRRDKAQK